MKFFYFLKFTTTFVFLTASIASADVIDFTETFDSGVANWAGAASNGSDPLNFIGSGGPDGSSYVSFDFNFSGNSDGDSASLFRGHDFFDSSNDAFVGDWIASGVHDVSLSFRHNLPVPVTVFARIASSNNFPGAIAIGFIPVFSNQWTDVNFDVRANSPQLVSFEGTSYNAVFSNVGNVQFGVSVPMGFGGNPVDFTYDIDNVTVTTVPEPAAFGITLTGLLYGLGRRRR